MKLNVAAVCLSQKVLYVQYLLHSIAAGASDEGITGDCQLLWWV